MRNKIQIILTLIICILLNTFLEAQTQITTLEQLAQGGTFKLINIHDNRALCTLHNSADPNYNWVQEPIILYDYYDNATHHWTIESTGNDTWKIRNTHDKRALCTRHYAADPSYKGNQEPVVLYDYYGNATQKWKFESTGNGHWAVKNVHDNRALCTIHNSTDPSYKGNQEPIILFDYYGNATQVWKIIRIDSKRSSVTETDRMNAGTTLYIGEKLVSENGRFEARMQTTGFLQVFAIPEEILMWTSGFLNLNQGRKLSLQYDANLVIYGAPYTPNDDRFALWSSETDNQGKDAVLLMQNDANLVLYATSFLGPRIPIWASNTVVNPDYFRKALRIIKIECHKTTENYDNDEIYFVSNNVEISANYTNISSNQTIELNIDIPLDKNGICGFEVREDDIVGSNLIGAFMYSLNVQAGFESFINTNVQSTKLTGGGGEYTIYYKYIPNRFEDANSVNPLNPSLMPGSAYATDAESEDWLERYSKNWMSKLPGGTKLLELSIPGTHDSGATNGGDAYECQSLSIKSQLKSGIRFFDIRVAPYKLDLNDALDLWVFHGGHCMDITLDQVLNDMKEFFEEQPKETIILMLSDKGVKTVFFQMMMKADGQVFDNQKEYNTLKDYYKVKYSSCFFEGYKDKIDMKLDSLRGKIVKLYDGVYDVGSDPVPHGNSEYVQNDYGVTAFSSTEKQKQVKDHINKAIYETPKREYYLNFTNGSVGMLPYDCAKNVNPATYEYLLKKPNKNRLGMIIMDFPGEHLIYKIIQSNFDFNSN